MATAAERMTDDLDLDGGPDQLRQRNGQLQRFFDDVEELLKRVSNVGDQEISRLRYRVESSINHAKAATREGARMAVESTRKAAKATDEYVHENPWKAIGVTAVLGVLVGALLRRK
jgi:ElaB/YqjD/DUF883 family membrane-anchored ribosome-binding protein